jgi:hypothetical protein
MSIKDPENIAPTMGHQGPHPERYHQIVYRRLDEATAECRSIEACRAALTDALKKLAKEITTQGSELNQLVTRVGPQ